MEHSLHDLFALFRPSNLIVIAVVLSLIGVWRRQAWGRVLLALTAAGTLVLAILPVGDWLLVPLEQRFSVPDPMPEKVDGIIVLGGAVRLFWTYRIGQPGLNEHAERMTEAIALSRRYPDARLIFTGGNTQRISESDVARQFFETQGMDMSRITFEDQSHSTYDNAVLTKKLIEPQPGQTWLLVTSAYHMPRSIGAFRKAGWDVVPYPVDYNGPRNYDAPLSFATGFYLDRLDDVSREWAALVVYYLRDRTDALFPGPRHRKSE
jgi:uncharacterized SAM-binding protein YcdF (DUF218 family)